MIKIVFLSYINRSGSTYLVNQLSKVPDICICPEADVLYDLLLSYPNKIIRPYHIRKWKALLDLDYKFQFWKLPISTILNSSILGKKFFLFFIDILIAFQKKHFPDSKIIVFKHNYIYKIFLEISKPGNIELYGFSLIRDPRSIYNSQKKTISPYTHRKMCTNPLHFIKEWNKYVDRHQSVSQFNNYSIIVFEDIILYFNDVMDFILNCLGIQESFNKYLNSLPKHTMWINSDYKTIHPDIDKLPIIANINKWKKEVNLVELEILTKYCCKNKYYSITKIAYSNFLNLFIFNLLFSFQRKQLIFKKLFQRVAFRIRYLI